MYMNLNLLLIFYLGNLKNDIFFYFSNLPLKVSLCLIKSTYQINLEYSDAFLCLLLPVRTHPHAVSKHLQFLDNNRKLCTSVLYCCALSLKCSFFICSFEIYYLFFMKYLFKYEPFYKFIPFSPDRVNHSFLLCQ